MPPILLFILFFLTSLKTEPSLATSLTFGPNLLVSDAPGTFGSSSDGPPIVDVDIAGGVYVAWIDHRSFQNEVFFSKLTPDGSGFSSNKPLTGINDPKSFPQIEEDSGNIYIAWGERRGPNFVQSVYFTKSADGGQTFGQQIVVDTNEGLPFSMVAHDNKLFIAYSKAGTEIWVASSFDGGANFTKNRISNFDNVTRQRPVIDFIGNNVSAFWFEGNKVFFAKSQDGGTNFDNPRSVFSHPNGAILLLGNTFGRLSTKVDQENIFLAFDFYLQTSIPFTTDFEVFFTKSADGGNTFSAAERLPDDNPPSGLVTKPRQQNPSLTLLPDGSPVIAWHDFRDGDRKVMLVYSQDQGDTFSQNFVINNTPTNNAFSAPTIAADNEGKIHFVRWDAVLSPIGIYYTKIDLGLQFETPPTPFLDLPWDYESKGLTFTEAALAINSYFDHEYPLLSVGLGEPTGTLGFDNINSPERFYSSHDGYDYSRDAGASKDTPVLAAASGCASYRKTDAGGNIILIDHGNDYQTRHLHLMDDGLVTKSSDCVQVTQGQQIGLVGFSGNVIPPGEEGSHIHFMVIQDKNSDGNFDDNIPDGVTDPFGWQSIEQDPWSQYEFNYDGQDRTGNKSFYLWTKPIANLSDQLTSNGGFFELERYTLNFPQNATNQNLSMEMEAAPVAKPSNTLESIGATLIVKAKDAFGNLVETFLGLFTITISFEGFDLTGYSTETISIYSSDDGINWVKEDTTVNFSEKTSSAEINHLSYFALMAERLDTAAPTTTAVLTGIQGQPNWFRSNVQMSLSTQDNEGGLGVDYTLFKIDGEGWQEHLSPLTFTAEGNYTVEFYSVDKDENIEAIKTIEFNIDKTPPSASINTSPNILWPPNGKLIDVSVSGFALDNSGITNFIFEVEDEYDQIEPALFSFGQIIKLEAGRKGNDKEGRKYKIKIFDLAGNQAESIAEIIVPHDQSNR